MTFEHVISMFTTAHNGIWVGLTSDVTSGTGLKHSRDFWLRFVGFQNIFGLFVIHIFIKLDKIFQWKNCII